MKNIKDITISIFAIIGFVAIVTGFTNEAEQQPTYGTPESHVWTITSTDSRAYALNKVTGEVRKYNLSMDKATKDPDYVVMKEFKSDKY